MNGSVGQMLIPNGAKAQSEVWKAGKMSQQLKCQQSSAQGVAIDAAMSGAQSRVCVCPCSHNKHSQREVDMIAWRY